MTETEILDVENVTVQFGDLTVIDEVSFGLDSGTVTCVVGPNGSGKTTLLRAVAGLVSPDSGTVERPTAGTRPVGYLAQAPAFRPQFSVRETLSFYADLIDEAVDPDQALERVGLDAVGGRRVEALSGGMTRLLGIAQATLGDPELLILDEPASGLDPLMSRHLTSVVSDLAAAGTTVLLATHDLRAVSRIADDVLLLDRGRLTAQGTPAALLSDTGADDLDGALSTLVDHEAGELTTRMDESVATAGGDS